jgi:hypothetical protein
MNSNNVTELSGLKVSHVDVGDASILLTTTCGRQFLFSHRQD